MKEDFIVHNLFWRNFEEFENLDPHLSKIKTSEFIYTPPLAYEIPVMIPGIYILTGGRQVGKSTTLKLIIKNLLKEKLVEKENIYYLPCDTIKDYNQLLFEIEQFFQTTTKDKPFVLFIDEITYVEEWGRAIKSLADSGFFNLGSVLITGSDSYLLKNAMMEFPGRRGMADNQDFHLFPLSFKEYVNLKEKQLLKSFENIRIEFDKGIFIPEGFATFKNLSNLKNIFSDYLLTGGYLSAINDFEKNKKINSAVYKTYLQWIIGDILKRGKSEFYLKEIIKALFLRLSKQITWNSLSKDVSIEHHQTIADYINLLTRMDVTFILQALREDKMRAAPKKAKKVSFCDPFIFHTLYGLIENKIDFFEASKHLLDSTSTLKNSLIEGSVSGLFNRTRESYYIKSDGEVDIAIITGKTFLPIEIKNSLTLNKNELKQILKYKKGIIGYAGSEIGKFEHLQVVPISLLAILAG